MFLNEKSLTKKPLFFIYLRALRMKILQSLNYHGTYPGELVGIPKAFNGMNEKLLLHQGRRDL